MNATTINKTVIWAALIAALASVANAGIAALVALQVKDVQAKVAAVKDQTDGITSRLAAANFQVGKAEGEKKGIVRGVAAEKARAAASKADQAKGVAIQQAKRFWER